MHDFNFEMNQYLTYCRTQKRLDGKTLKSYRIDLTQFGVSLAAAFPSLSSISELSPAILESYIATLHEQFKPKTVKRKLASLKAFFHYPSFSHFVFTRDNTPNTYWTSCPFCRNVSLNEVICYVSHLFTHSLAQNVYLYKYFTRIRLKFKIHTYVLYHILIQLGKMIDDLFIAW